MKSVNWVISLVNQKNGGPVNTVNIEGGGVRKYGINSTLDLYLGCQ